MSAFTPQQIRALAEIDLDDDHAPLSIREWQELARVALRAAAHQLEAVRAWNWRHEGLFVDQNIEAILTADKRMTS